MANEWFRVWHGMPNDPKFKTISLKSGQPKSLVISVWLHLMDSASQNVTRGHADVTLEDVASAIECDESAVLAIYDAMQGRLLDGMRLTGWEKRQPKKEDSGNPQNGVKSAAERKREQREREKQAKENAVVTTSHDESRNVTLDKDTEKDTDKDKTTTGVVVGGGVTSVTSGVTAPLVTPPAEQPGLSRPIAKNWRPNPETMGMLAQHNIPENFIWDLVPEFELYWRERGEPALTWGNKFLKHAIRHWREFQASPPATPAQRLPASWTPSHEAIDALTSSGIDRAFIASLIPEFVIFWRESNRAQPSWNAKFMSHTQLKWSHRQIDSDPLQRSTRDIPLHDQLTNRDWADPQNSFAGKRALT